MGLPLVLITGVDAVAMAFATMSLQWDTPGVVVIRQEVDPESYTIRQIISDADGLVETSIVQSDHWCVTCPVESALTYAISRCASAGRWRAIIVQLPAGADARNLCQLLVSYPKLSRQVHVSSVITALRGDREPSGLAWDLIGDDFLSDHGLHSCRLDRLGVGQVLSAMVEFSDITAIVDPCGPTSFALTRSLAPTGALILRGAHELTGAAVFGRRRQPQRTEAPRLLPRQRTTSTPGTWQVEVNSPWSIHPRRLAAALHDLGLDPARSRGTFWVASRPGVRLWWDGAGPHLNIGVAGSWNDAEPQTRLLITGIGDAPENLREKLEQLLLDPDESLDVEVGHDGLEPWLGEIRQLT